MAVIFGGPSPEHDVSILTGLQSVRALLGAGWGVQPIYWSKPGGWHLVDPGLEAEAFAVGVPRGSIPVRLALGPGGGLRRSGRMGERAIPVAAAVNCCHGSPGEDGTLQGALDLAGIPYTGPTVAGAALGMDKLAFHDVAAAAGLPVLERELLEGGKRPELGDGPFIVKPRYGGSSIGIDVVTDAETAWARLTSNTHLASGAVVEPYRPDLYDIQIAVRCWPGIEVSAIERPIRAGAHGEILDYRDKYVAGEGMAGAARELPAQVDKSVAARVVEIARRVASLCAVRGVARVDFLSDGVATCYLNEINTVPGSLARYLWIEPLIEFSTLLEEMITEALARPAHRWSSAGADGSVLRSAGSIAAKLA